MNTAKKRKFCDNVKTTICIIAIVVAVVAYLQTSQSGTLLVQRDLNSRITELNGVTRYLVVELDSLNEELLYRPDSLTEVEDAEYNIIGMPYYRDGVNQ